MIAAVYRSTGGSSVLEVEEVPTPSPGAGEVLVRVVVAGVNPTDWKSRAGATGGLGFEFQVPGQDGAGVVEAVGGGASGGRPRSTASCLRRRQCRCPRARRSSSARRWGSPP